MPSREKEFTKTTSVVNSQARRCVFGRHRVVDADVLRSERVEFLPIQRWGQSLMSKTNAYKEIWHIKSLAGHEGMIHVYGSYAQDKGQYVCTTIFNWVPKHHHGNDRNEALVRAGYHISTTGNIVRKEICTPSEEVLVGQNSGDPALVVGNEHITVHPAVVSKLSELEPSEVLEYLSCEVFPTLEGDDKALLQCWFNRHSFGTETKTTATMTIITKIKRSEL